MKSMPYYSSQNVQHNCSMLFQTLWKTTPSILIMSVLVVQRPKRVNVCVNSIAKNMKNQYQGNKHTHPLKVPKLSRKSQNLSCCISSNRASYHKRIGTSLGGAGSLSYLEL